MNRPRGFLKTAVFFLLLFWMISIIRLTAFASDVPTKVIVLPPGQTTMPTTSPIIIRLAPVTGDISGGIPGDIYGNDFSDPVQVFFGDAEAQVNFIDSTHIQVVIPPHAVGPITVTLINSDGAKATATFTYIQPTVLDRILPPQVVQALPATGVVTTGGVTLLTVLSSQEFIRLLFIPWVKRKKYWGVVLSKSDLEPIPLTVINLYDSSSKKLIKSTISNMQGQYGLIVDPGQYVIEAKHPQYVFDPAPENSNAYHGQPIAISNSKNYTLNIFMQKPVEAHKFNLWYSIKLVFERFLDLFEKLYPFISTAFLISDVIFFLMSGDIVYFFLSIYMAVLLVIFFVGGWIQPKQWGLVVDKNTGKPIPNSYIKLYNLDDPGIADTIITDKRGRFEMLLSKGRYQLVVNAPGYRMPVNVGVNGILIEQKRRMQSLQIKMEPVSSTVTAPAGFKFGVIS